MMKFSKKILLSFTLFLTLSLTIPITLQASKKWTGSIAKGFDQQEDWNLLLSLLKEHHLHYGALASSARMLNYFIDLKSKENAYQTLIHLIDIGYPYTVRHLFASGDLELSTRSNFDQSYNLYKATINLDKNMKKWAETYFSRVDKELFPKYLFYQALELYEKKQFKEALTILEKALTLLKEIGDLALSKKISRLIARIYYEQGEYEKALDIYQNYLLRLNPIHENDWIEAAWCLYRLGKFDEALGFLYNLELPRNESDILLEGYVIRALIYREKCATKYTQNLLKSFDHEFGSVIEGIKLGEPLSSYPLLKKIYLPESISYLQILRSINELEVEAKTIKSIFTEKTSKKLIPLAEYLYSSEIKALQKIKKTFEDEALSKAARHLVIMGESLRFLKFDVVREKYNPDKVFAVSEPIPESHIETLPDKRFLLHFLQWGDFWRDERLLYKGIMRPSCQ